MGLFKAKEAKAEAENKGQGNEAGQGLFDDVLLSALLGQERVTKKMALQVPTLSGGLDLIGNIVAATPLKLYREKEGKAEEIRDDPRVALLNDDTGDTLSAVEFWKAMVRDYYTGKGAYAYLHRERGRFVSIHYVDEEQVSFQQSADPIFKDFDILVQGRRYRPFEFLRVLRNTKDGMQGVSVVEENSRLIQTAYETLVFEQNLVKKGGNKRGFLKSPKKLAKEAFAALKEAFRRSYQNGEENVLILNEGVEFQEASNTSVEMQLNENKVTNAGEFAKLFHISPDIMSGRGTETDVSSLARLAAIPLMTAIQCALNRDFLLEREKGEYYWAFDTKELLKGSMRERFEAYKMALDANFFQVDEVRYLEDLEPLGFRWMKLGLEDVLFDPKTGKIFTPNTGQMGNMAEGKLEGLPSPEAQDAGAETPPSADPQEVRGNPNHDPGNGRFTSGPGGGTVLTSNTKRDIVKLKKSELKNRLPISYKANATVDMTDSTGKTLQRRVYGPDGKAAIDFDISDHGLPHSHPTGAHKHVFNYSRKNPHGDPLPLSKQELLENSDIIKKGVNYRDPK